MSISISIHRCSLTYPGICLDKTIVGWKYCKSKMHWIHNLQHHCLGQLDSTKCIPFTPSSSQIITADIPWCPESSAVMLAQERMHCILRYPAEKLSCTFPQLEFIWNKHHRHGSDTAALLGSPCASDICSSLPKSWQVQLVQVHVNSAQMQGTQNSLLPSKLL